MFLEDNKIYQVDDVINQIKVYLQKDQLTDQELDELGEMAFLLFDKYNIRPYFPKLTKNEIIGVKSVVDISPDFFKNISRVKYLLEFISIKPLLTIMKQDYFVLPCDRTEDFSEFLNQLFTKYIDDLQLVTKSDAFNAEDLNAVKQLCIYLSESIDNYFGGYPSLAYESLSNGMEIVTKYSKEFLSEKPRHTHLYRMRTGSNHYYSRKEMFHIPFELRGIVTTQRYSVPGLPCLYLGSSSFVCWEEMNRPDLNTIHTSMFAIKPDRNLKLLDLGFPPTSISESIKYLMSIDFGSERWQNFLNAFRGYLVIWPVIAACSVRVLNKSDAFKPEYIIPQLLLQWVRISSNYDGICYFSVASNSLDSDNSHLFLNYAFPVKNNEKEGHCRNLKELFWVTQPVPWQIFQLYKNSGEVLRIKDNQSGYFEPLAGSKIPYAYTDFAKLEAFLIDKQRPMSI